MKKTKLTLQNVTKKAGTKYFTLWVTPALKYVAFEIIQSLSDHIVNIEYDGLVEDYVKAVEREEEGEFFVKVDPKMKGWKIEKHDDSELKPKKLILELGD